MAHTSTFTSNGAKSGKIAYKTSYTVTTGNVSCDVGQNLKTSPLTETRAFFNFDTSSLPDDCVITAVIFFVRLDPTQPSTAPEAIGIQLYMGTFIGASLDSADWGGGTLAMEADYWFMDTEEVDLTASKSLVGKTGDTDIRLQDVSDQGSGDNIWSRNFNYSAAVTCELRVTYGWNWASATGKGLVGSAAGKVFRGGTASLTGKGLLGTASGKVLCKASATVTGIGHSAGAGTVARRAAASVTGQGLLGAVQGCLIRAGAAIATGSLLVGLAIASPVRSAAATATCSGLLDQATASPLRAATSAVTGAGFAAGAGTVVPPIGGDVPGAATATGSGLVDIAIASPVRSATSSVTGRGLGSAKGSMEGAGAATATGHGLAGPAVASAICSAAAIVTGQGFVWAVVPGWQVGEATATGRGLIGRAFPFLEAWAVHRASRSVTPCHPATRSVMSAHVAIARPRRTLDE